MHLSKSRLITLSISFALFLHFLGAVCPVAAQEPGGRIENSSPNPETHPIPDGMVFRKVVVSRDGTVTEQPATSNGGEVSGEPGEKLIYSNTLGSVAVNFPNSQPVSDDIAVTAPDGCNLIRYKFRVLGKVNPSGSTGAYTVNYGLYTNCPLAVGSNNTTRDLVRIPGTEGSITFPDDAPREIEHLIPWEPPVVLSANVYLSIRFNRTNCGTIVGAPPMLGFSGDVWDYPGFPCIGYLGGFPEFPHASMWLEIYGAENCADAFPGYKCYRPSGSTALLGANVQGVDDVTLQVDDCEMVGYEVAVRGTGFYTFDLRRACDGQVIAGTARTFQVNVSTQPQLQMARFTFNPPIPLNAQSVFLAFKSSSNSSGAVVAGIKPVVGESSEEYFEIGLNGCAPLIPTQGVHGAINLAITCAGTLPNGACCDIYRPDAQGNISCRELPEMNCPMAPEGHWLKGQQCEDEPFSHPCGEGACCVTDYGCEDIGQMECEVRQPSGYSRSWLPDKTCADEDPSCSAGDCSAFHETPGCSDFACEEVVCSLDSWCCHTEWDTLCTGYAVEHCDAGPRNDTCRPMGSGVVAPDGSALLVTANSTTLMNTEKVELISPFVCPIEESIPGSLWFRFTAIAGTARISTCESIEPLDFRHLSIYHAPSGSSLGEQCSSLSSLACIQDFVTCANGRNSDWCMFHLTPGEDYFVQLGLDHDTPRGLLRLDIESPCPLLQQRIADMNHTASNAVRNTGVAITETLGPNHSVNRMAQADSTRSVLRTFGVRSLQKGATNQLRGIELQHTSVQVNVDGLGLEIPGDEGNEPSIAIDPTNPLHMVIGWRQFLPDADGPFAGWAYSHDGGISWVYPGVIEPGLVRGFPVLGSDASGVFYYLSKSVSASFSQAIRLFRSYDHGLTWDMGISFGTGDQLWMDIDGGPGLGRGNVYTFGERGFYRGSSPNLEAEEFLEGLLGTGTVEVAADGSVWLGFEQAGDRTIVRSFNASRNGPIVFADLSHEIQLNRVAGNPNPDGLKGRTWIASSPLGAPRRQSAVLVDSISRGTSGWDVEMMRTDDNGRTWSPLQRVSDDPTGVDVEQWFGMVDIAPSGRIDIVWNDTRNDPAGILSQVFYSYSEDGGETWSLDAPVSDAFDSDIDGPGRLGNQYDLVSDGKGVHVAYAATFNGEHDVYYLRLLPPVDCNKNGVYDPDDIAGVSSADTNNDDVPDECQSDFDADGLLDDIDADIDGDGVANGTDFCLFTKSGEPVSQNGAARMDTNENCSIDVNDWWRFQYCMAGGIGFITAPESACLAAFDRDQSKRIDLRDFAVFQNALEP